MTTPDALKSGKGHRDENFPVASLLIRPRYRAVILAFYRFARAADDVADNVSAGADEKLKLLDDMASSLRGDDGGVAQSVNLRRMIAERRLGAEHAFDLLEAFRRVVTKLR
jgi:phytoene/squalene synthetase